LFHCRFELFAILLVLKLGEHPIFGLDWSSQTDTVSIGFRIFIFFKVMLVFRKNHEITVLFVQVVTEIHTSLMIEIDLKTTKFVHYFLFIKKLFNAFFICLHPLIFKTFDLKHLHCDEF
jgi:hypothetical protein